MQGVKLNKATAKATFVDDITNPPYKTADVAMLGVACDLTATYNKGAWHGPHAIIEASYQVEFASPGFHIPLTERVKIHNMGILECMKSINRNGNQIKYTKTKIKRVMECMVNQVDALASKVMDDGKLLILFGGDHSVPNGVWNVMERAYGLEKKDVTVLQFDGHLDLRDEIDGCKYSHACIMRRARDKGFRVIQVGPRDHISAEEAEYIGQSFPNISSDIYFCATQPNYFYEEWKSKLSPNISLPNLIQDGELNEHQLSSLERKIKDSKYLWISIDVDGLDASDIPGTGTPLPMGLTRKGMRTALYHAIRTARRYNIHIVGFDINEVAPQLRKEAPYSPINTVSTMNEMDAALLAYNLLFWMYLDRFTK